MRILDLTKASGIVLFAICLATESCKKDKPFPEEVKRPNVDVYVLTDDNKLSKVNPSNRASSATVNITGLQSKESLIAIDFRPSTGQLYGLGSLSRIYVINAKTGEARAIGSGSFTPALTGNTVGFDFNPTVDRIRIVTSEGQNLRVNPETGGVAFVDGTIANTSMIGAVAYTENKAGASTTILFDIDSKNDRLYKQDPPNAGTLVEVGKLNVDADESGGFDISPDGKAALAALSKGGVSSLYTINLTTGSAVEVSKLNGNVLGIAIPTDPVAYAIGAANEFLIFNPESGATVNKTISGLAMGETVLGLDARPSNGQLYLLGSTSRIYTVNASSGVAAAVGSTIFATMVSGTSFGFDFNPTVDRIRIVSNTGQNLRVHPETGVVAFVDGMIKPGTPSITAAAYTNNFAGATTTTLFDIDSETNMLYKQDPPNEGTLVPVGSLNIDISAASGFDIGGNSGTAFAMLTNGSITKLYTINLSTGSALPVKDFPMSVRGFTIGLGF